MLKIFSVSNSFQFSSKDKSMQREIQMFCYCNHERFYSVVGCGCFCCTENSPFTIKYLPYSNNLAHATLKCLLCDLDYVHSNEIEK